MTQLMRCTGKLQKEMGLKKADLYEGEPRVSRLGQWHANLVYIDGKKCVLFANDKTLFNFIIPHLRKKDIAGLDTLFRAYLQTMLAEEGFSKPVIEKILAEYATIRFGKTNSKKLRNVSTVVESQESVLWLMKITLSVKLRLFVIYMTTKAKVSFGFMTVVV